MLGDVVELPITLIQDHTLMEILRDSTIDAWVRKCEWIERNHGLVNLITHPDYLVEPDRLAMYEQFLQFLGRREGCWRALPREIAEWWRVREGLSCGGTSEQPGLLGAGRGRARLAWAVELDDRIAFDLGGGLDQERAFAQAGSG
jgi:hypothetical protein